ncbi:peptidase [Shewanella aegiceratis]|uniref:peptidase n=1 Tax=Shewanella aegiceratis TaxID=2864203 RepID=UPI001C65C779|nr:peptidase [Shewanella aegiceratis]QYJ82098.1 peptidase [Shewanella aegiceratis]
MLTPKQSRWLRKSHKWLTLFMGAQLLIWLISGLYMVIMDIDYIHGDHLVDESRLTLDASQLTISPEAILSRYPEANRLELLPTALGPVYKLRLDGKALYLSGQNGEPLEPLTQQDAMQLARLLHPGSLSNASSELLTKSAPAEIGGRGLPLWQINLNDAFDSRLYISASSGELLAKRHDFWRLFDLMWMLHIMDYDTREDVHNPLLTGFSLLALLTALSGALLLLIAFKRGEEEPA